MLKAVSARGATLDLKDGGAQVALSIAPPAPAATGTLPGAGAPAALLPRAALQRPPRQFTPTQPQPGAGRAQLPDNAIAVQPEGQSGGPPPAD